MSITPQDFLRLGTSCPEARQEGTSPCEAHTSVWQYTLARCLIQPTGLHSQQGWAAGMGGHLCPSPTALCPCLPAVSSAARPPLTTMERVKPLLGQHSLRRAKLGTSHIWRGCRRRGGRGDGTAEHVRVLPQAPPAPVQCEERAVSTRKAGQGGGRGNEDNLRLSLQQGLGTCRNTSRGQEHREADGASPLPLGGTAPDHPTPTGICPGI